MADRDRRVSFSLGRAARCGLALALIILAVPAGAPAQERRQQQQQYRPANLPPPSEPATSTVIVSPDEDYLIGAADILDIRILDAPELSGTYRVNADGTVQLPFLGEVGAKRKTTRELSRLLADRLRHTYLTDPQVVVAVKQSNSRAFFIQGAVRRPGVYQIEGHPSLLKTITVAGGLSDNYGSTAFIIRRIKADEGQAAAGAAPPPAAPPTGAEAARPEYELVKANISGLLRGNFEQNVLLEPGDIIHIPPTDVFFVAGEVNSPGSFPLKEGTTLRQAVSLAQGVTFSGSLKNGVIFRESPATGKRQEIKVDIGGVMNGKLEDVAIQANDIIIVPNSKVKAIGNTLLTGFGVNVPFIFANRLGF